MYTVLLRIQASLQSWGDGRGYSVRLTTPEPTKSGLLGLLCAMGGVPWADDVTLINLRKCWLGVRVDRRGTPLVDYQVAKSVPYTNPGKHGHKDTEPSHVHYLCDASYLVGLETDSRDLADWLYGTARCPYRTPYLGRKSCLPGIPITQPGPPVQEGLLEALLGSPWLAMPWEYDAAVRDGVRVGLSLDDSKALRKVMDLTGRRYYRVARMDNPVSFFPTRRYESRVVLITEAILRVIKIPLWIKEQKNEVVVHEAEPSKPSGQDGLEQSSAVAQDD
jgi:CRISPR system Cascade subunit CasD